MKVKELQEKLAGVNPEAEVAMTIGAQGMKFEITTCIIGSEIIQLICEETNEELIRKALLVQYDVYHPSLNKDWEEGREKYAESMADFLTSYLSCDMEEAMEIANNVMDEVASLSVEEVKARIERKECIGAVINRIVGREIIPSVLPDMK